MQSRKETSIIHKISKKIHKKTPKIINNIEIIFDQSGSMGSIKNKAIESINNQLTTIKDNSINSNQEVNIGINFFNDRVTRRIEYHNAEDIKLVRVQDYNPQGNTALYDAIGETFKKVNYSPNKTDDNVAYLLIVVTDGEENSSRLFSANQIKEAIHLYNSTDKWTFAFSIPASGVKRIKELGIPNGCIQTWDGTEKGLELATTNTSMAYANYTAIRSAGVTSMDNVYLNLSKITKFDIKSLTKVTNSFYPIVVNEESSISDFVNKKVTKSRVLANKLGTSYVPGNGYYQISKPETVQDYKQILLMDVKTNDIYTGDRDDINSILGLSDCTCKITPFIGGQYQVFVQSKSNNRKLVRGTMLMYKVV